MTENIILMLIAMTIMTVVAFLLGFLFASIDKPQEQPKPTVLHSVYKSREKKPEAVPPDEVDINTFYQ